MTEAELMGRVRESGLSRVADDLERLLKPSIRIKTRPVDEAKLTLGESKFGGVPDLPPEIEWPERNGQRLDLIAQLNLSEITSLKPPAYQLSLLDVGSDLSAFDALPQAGILYFFYDVTEQRGGYKPEDRGGWKVIHYDGDSSRLKRCEAASALPEDGPLPACRLEFAKEVTLPDLEEALMDRLWLSDAEEDAYWEVIKGVETSTQICHRLLGYPQIIQNAMEGQCAVLSHGLADNNANRRIYEPEEVEWHLLLQVDSDDNAEMSWGDVGRLYFWIRKAHFRAHDFEGVWLVLQCH